MPRNITTSQLEREGARIRAKYAYMSTLSLSGWMWEMIRRGQKYSDLIQLCRSAQEKVNGIAAENDFFEMWSREFSAIGLDVLSYQGADYAQEDCYHIIGFDDALVDGWGGVYLALPRTDKKYDDFPNDNRPPIIGTRLVKSMKYSHVSALLEDVSNEDGGLEPGAIDELLAALTPLKFDGTLFVGISFGNKDEIMIQLESIVRRFIRSEKKGLEGLKPRRRSNRRKDKWKYYLIAYDLKKNDPNLLSSDIGTILQEAYPEAGSGVQSQGKPDEKDPWNEKNIENYIKGANLLIDSAGYKKYLRI